MSMQALVLNRYNGPLELTEIPRPIPAAGEVLVRISASGLNPLTRKIRAGSGDMQSIPCRLYWVSTWRVSSKRSALASARSRWATRYME